MAELYDAATDAWTDVPEPLYPIPGRAKPALIAPGRLLFLSPPEYNGDRLCHSQIFDDVDLSWLDAGVPGAGCAPSLLVLLNGDVIAPAPLEQFNVWRHDNQTWDIVEMKGFECDGGMYFPDRESWGLLGDGRIFFPSGTGCRNNPSYIWDFTTNTLTSVGVPPNGTWGRFAPLGLTLPDGRVAFGSMRASGSSKGARFHVFDPDDNSWASSPVAPSQSDPSWWNGLDVEQSPIALADGRILVIGPPCRYGDFGAAYDAAGNAWTEITPMGVEGCFYAVAPLDRDHIVVVGGAQGGGSACDEMIPLDVVEIYDVSTDTWRGEAPRPKLASIRNHASHAHDHAAVLSDGRVLVMGGILEGGHSDTYDPDADVWLMNSDQGDRFNVHFATELSNGLMVAIGENVGRLFDPQTSTWYGGPPSGQAATLLTSGHVFAIQDGIGGAEWDPAGGRPGTYEGATNFSEPMLEELQRVSAAALVDGRALVLGQSIEDGEGEGEPRAEYFTPGGGQYNGSAGAFSAAPAPPLNLLAVAPVQLPGGAIATVGRDPEDDSIHLMTFALGTWIVSAPVPGERGAWYHPPGLQLESALAVLGDGRLFFASHPKTPPPAGALGSPQKSPHYLYDPLRDGWTTTSDMRVARERFAVAALPNGSVLVSGGLETLCLPGGWNSRWLRTSELFDPDSDSWTTSGEKETPE